MKIRTTTHFDKRIHKRLKKKPSLREKTKKQVEILSVNMRHPSLKMHKLEGKRATEYSIWIEKNLRITFQLISGEILLTDIITHDEY